MPHSSNTLSLSAKKHIDEVCLRFESAWQQAPRPALEHYLEDVTEPEFSSLLCELLLLDLDYRLHAGETPDADAYHVCFPGHGRIVQSVFRQCGLPCAAAGTRIRYFGDYELIDEIARGGMGVVYKARQVSLNRLVALKMILAGQLATPEQVERFHREAQAAAALQHPNIVEIHEVGEHEGQQYFSMDFVDGRSLAEMARESPLAPHRAARYIQLAARAVHYAHEQGTLHRDLKPANLLIDQLDQLRITDFGLAKQTQIGSELTTSGQVLGTPSYMPPEQAVHDRGEVGPASDIYALGAVLYELVTGRPPFKAETPAQTLLEVLEREPPAPRLLSPKLPRDLETIALKCLEKEPRRRYRTARELAEDLERFMEGKPILARPAGRAERLWRWCRRKPLVAALSGATLGLLVVVAVGASLACLLLAHERSATLRAEQDAVDKLWQSYLDQARARRWSGRPGRRVESLEALANAAAIRPSLDLRNEAIACLALVDLRVAKEWEGFPPGSYGLAFDAKLERYTVSDAKGNLSLRTVDDNREIVRLPGPGNPAWVVRFSPSGRYLAAKYSPFGENEANRVWVWDLTRGQAVLKTEDPVLNVALSFSPDDRLLAVGWMKGGISLYDLSSLVEAEQLPSEAPVDYITFHPDGTRFASRTLDGRIFVCNAADGRTLHVLSGEEGPVWSAAGRLLAVGCADMRIRVYDADSWQERAVLEGSAYAFAFSHSGELLATAGGEPTIRLWNPFDSSPLLTVQGASVGAVPAFAPGDRLLGHRIDGARISLFEVLAAPECRKLIVEPASNSRVWYTDVSPDGRFLAGAYDDGIHLWDLGKGDQVALLPGSDVRTAKFTPDGTGLITSGSSGLWRWPLEQDGQPGGELVRIGRCVRVVLPEGTAAGGCSLDHAGRTLAVAAGDVAWVFDLKTQHETARFGNHNGLNGAVLSPDARWLACSSWHGSGVKVFDAQNGKLALSVPKAISSGATFSPDGKWLAVATGPEYRLWSVGSWEPGLRIARVETTDMPGPMAFSPDGQILALVVSWPLVRLIDVASGLELATLEAPDVDVRIWALSFSPDGTCLIAGSHSHRLHIWDLRLIRQRLAAMGLDWDLPPYPPAAKPAALAPLSVEVGAQNAAE